MKVSLTLAAYQVGSGLLPVKTVIPISKVASGSFFDLAVLVQDLRTDDPGFRGVFAAYFNLTWDAALMARVGDPQYGFYKNGQRGFPARDGIVCLGAFCDFTPPGIRQVELVRMRMKTVADVAHTHGSHGRPTKANPIETTIDIDVSSPPLIMPLDATLVYADLRANPPEDMNVRPDEIELNPVTLTIG